MDKANYGIFSFFSGAGFLDLGFESVDSFDILFVNEYHEPFLDIYKSSRESLNIKLPKYGYFPRDISDLLSGSDSEQLKDFINDAISQYDKIGFIGGPPCPDFSIGGKNRGANGENGKLTDTYFKAVIQNKPDFFLFENVKGLYRTKKHRAFFEDKKAELRSEGYLLTEKLINSLEYGVAQDRERIILIGLKEANLQENLNNGGNLNFDWDFAKIFNVEDVLNNDWPKMDQYLENGRRRRPRNIIEELTTEFWFRKNDVYNHPNSEHYFKPRAGLSKFQSIPEGDDLKKSYKRLHRWRYSPTAAYGNNEVHIHPYKSRRLTVAEALAIQSLPKDYFIPDHISLTNMFKAIGNGVPYLAAKGLALTIREFLLNLDSVNINEKVIGS